MKTIVNKSDVTATTVDTITLQVVELLRGYGYEADMDSDFNYDKEGFAEEECSTDIIQELFILGEITYNWQTSIKVVIFEHHSHTTDEYYYTVVAFEF